MRNRRDLWLIVLMLMVITVLHYFTAHYRLQLHEFYRRLYYIPIIYGAFRFRFRGGVLISAVASILYAPHLLFYVGHLRLDILNQFMEIVLFLVIGVGTGSLTELQRRQQRIVEKQLERITNLENYTHNVLQSMANGLVALDNNLRITVFNQRLGKWLDWTDDVRGKPFFDLFQGKDVHKALFRDVLRTGNGINGMEVIVPTEREFLPLRVFIQPLHTAGNIIYGLVVIFEDLREVRILEEEVRRAERLSAVGVMASGIAHEIRNPLGIIKTISQNIQADGCNCNHATQQGLDIIEEEISRANRVISELLDFARPVPYRWEYIDIEDLARDVVLTTDVIAAQSKVVMSVEGLTPRAVRADRMKLKQALVNLVLNGIQSQPHGGLVKISLEETSLGLKIRVMDAGPGVPREIADKIFNPFFSVREGGTGLGLAVTHRIIEEHGATIDVSSPPGQGAEFTITLPWSQEEEMSDGNDSDS